MRYCHLLSLSDLMKGLCAKSFSVGSPATSWFNKNSIFPMQTLLLYKKDVICFARVVIQWHCSRICCSATADNEKMQTLGVCS